jgi:phage terminase large subunit
MSSRAIKLAHKINWKDPIPSYERVAAARLQNLKRLAERPGALDSLLAYYLDGHWAEFICDWGWTFDPREQNIKLQYRPFILTPRQIEYVDWVYRRFTKKQFGLCRKHRDAGMSWLNVAIGALLWLARPNTVIIYGSQKEEKVDAGPNAPGSLLWKARTFISRLPIPFQPPGWLAESKAFQVANPKNKSILLGQIGDSIGRGDRATIAFPDEFGELQHPVLVESSLSATTDCIIYGGTIPTSGWRTSHFYLIENRLPSDQVFIFNWEEDSRKRQNPDIPPEQEAWYKEFQEKLSPSVFKTQCLMIDDAASAVQFVPTELILNAFNRRASEVLIHPKLPWRVGVDAAGMGNDKIKIWRRRGRLNLPVLTYGNMDGIQLAMVIQKVVEDLLLSGPAELVGIEQDGPGGSAADQLRRTRIGQILVSVHTGAKVGDGKHYNLRAYLHAEWKRYLEEQEPVLPYSQDYLRQATAIHYEYKGGLLLIESKDQYRKRFAAGTSAAEKLSSSSPDDWDSSVLTMIPPRGRPLESLAPVYKMGSSSRGKNAYAL